MIGGWQSCYKIIDNDKNTYWQICHKITDNGGNIRWEDMVQWKKYGSCGAQQLQCRHRDGKICRRYRRRLCKFFPAVLLVLDFHTICCTILRIFAQFCCVFEHFCKILQNFANFCIILLIFAHLCVFFKVVYRGGTICGLAEGVVSRVVCPGKIQLFK